MDSTVYFLLQHLLVGGIEICVTNVANSLVSRGYSVTFLTLFPENQIVEKIDPRIKIECLTSLHAGRNYGKLYKLYRRCVSYWALRRKLKSLKNSVVVSTRNEYSVMVSRFVSPDNLRIAQLHNDYMPYPKCINDMANCYGNIDRYLLLTEDVCAEVEAIIRPKNIHTKCITIPNFLPVAEAPSATSKLDVEFRLPLALAVGRLASEKGFLRLLDAWKIVDDKYQGRFKLRIVGEGVERRALEDKITDLSLRSSVELFGIASHSQVIEMMRQARVYCMSSFTEAFSLTLLESLHNGLPQVAYDVRVGPRNLIANGQSGYLVTDGDCVSYAEKLETLLVDDALWKRASVASELRSDMFSEDKVMQQWERVINRNDLLY